MGNILGISPGTRSIGIAYVKDGKLIDWDIRTFSQKWSDKKHIVILDWVKGYIQINEIDVIAIKIPDKLPTSSNYIKLVATMHAMFEGMAVLPIYYMLSDLKKHYCPNLDANKAVLADSIVNHYPQLVPNICKGYTSLNGYYSKVLEAVAVARLQYEQVNK